MVTWAQVVSLCPDVATVPLAAQTLILAFVDGELDATRWGSKYTLGAIYYCAHLGLGALAGSGSSAGPVISESVGGVSVAYGVSVAQSPTDLGSTGYGRQYQTLARQVGMGGFCTST